MPHFIITVDGFTYMGTFPTSCDAIIDAATKIKGARTVTAKPMFYKKA